MPDLLSLENAPPKQAGERMIRIDSITIRLIPQTENTKNRYTTGELDPDMVSLVVEARSGETSGFGECVPTSIIYKDGHIGRSAIDEWQVVQDYAGQLIGRDARLLGALIPDELRIKDANSIVDAVDFALHDLVGKVVGLPVWALLGSTGRDKVWGMPVVHMGTPDEMAEKAAGMFERGGYRWYKLKPIGNIEQDREAMIKIREKTTAQARFFADPNYALKMDLQEVIQYANELHEHGLMVLEDPINVSWADYREIQEKTPVHVMLDEKARTPADVLEIAKQKCARFINIHANWAGGFAAGLFKANIAHAAGLGVIVGSSSYLGIGIAAYQTLSSVLPSEQPCEQTNKRSKESPGPTVPNPYHTEDGMIHITDAPGLGIDVDTEMLDMRASKQVLFD